MFVCGWRCVCYDINATRRGRKREKIFVNKICERGDQVEKDDENVIGMKKVSERRWKEKELDGKRKKKRTRIKVWKLNFTKIFTFASYFSQEAFFGRIQDVFSRGKRDLSNTLGLRVNPAYFLVLASSSLQSLFFVHTTWKLWIFCETIASFLYKTFFPILSLTQVKCNDSKEMHSEWLSNTENEEIEWRERERKERKEEEWTRGCIITY